MINAAKIWLRKHKATSGEIPAYVSYIRNLISFKILEEYEMKWSQSKWKYILR